MPNWRLTANDADVTAALASRLTSLRLTDQSGVDSDVLEITLADTDLARPVAIPKTGAELELWLGYMGAGSLTRMGRFVCDEIELAGYPGEMTIRARAATYADTPKGKTSLQTQKIRSWPAGTTLGAMLTKIAREHGMEPAITASKVPPDPAKVKAENAALASIKAAWNKELEKSSAKLNEAMQLRAAGDLAGAQAALTESGAIQKAADAKYKPQYDAKQAELKALNSVVKSIIGGTKLPHISQSDESDINLLIRIARKYDCVVKPAGGKLVLAKRGAAMTPSGEALPVVTVQNTDLVRWRVVMSSRETAGMVVAYWHAIKQSKRNQVSVGSGEPVRRLKMYYPTQEMALAAAKAELARRERQQVTLALDLEGRTDLAAESRLNLVGFRPGVAGEWIISRVVHSLDGSGYRCQVEAERPSETLDGAV